MDLQVSAAAEPKGKSSGASHDASLSDAAALKPTPTPPSHSTGTTLAASATAGPATPVAGEPTTQGTGPADHLQGPESSQTASSHQPGLVRRFQNGLSYAAVLASPPAAASAGDGASASSTSSALRACLTLEVAGGGSIKASVSSLTSSRNEASQSRQSDPPECSSNHEDVKAEGIASGSQTAEPSLANRHLPSAPGPDHDLAAAAGAGAAVDSPPDVQDLLQAGLVLAETALEEEQESSPAQPEASPPASTLGAGDQPCEGTSASSTSPSAEPHSNAAQSAGQQNTGASSSTCAPPPGPASGTGEYGEHGAAASGGEPETSSTGVDEAGQAARAAAESGHWPFGVSGEAQRSSAEAEAGRTAVGPGTGSAGAGSQGSPALAAEKRASHRGMQLVAKLNDEGRRMAHAASDQVVPG